MSKNSYVHQFDQTAQLALMFQAVQAARNGIVMTNPNLPDNPIIYVNPAFTEISGYSAEEILGRNCRFLQGGENEQPGLHAIRKALKEESSVTAVLRNYKKNGSIFFNELTISPVRDEQGKLVAYVGVQNDITDRIEAQARISDFYSVVSHELRTPIAKIKSSLAVIADGEAGPVGEAVSRFVSIAVKSADSLWRLIENILDFKKLESGKLRLIKQNLAMAQLLESTIAEFEPVAVAASVNLKYECLASPSVYADGQWLVQVVENLLSNAVKFSPAGSEVIVRLMLRDEKWVRVEVIDLGPGIAEVDMVKLFEKFQQLESPDQRVRGGTGLGLAVCKAIIQAHGGQVGVLSRLGQGSNFWFEIEQSK